MSKKPYSAEVEKLVQEHNRVPDEEYQAAQLWLAVDQDRQQGLHPVAQKYLESALKNPLIRSHLPEHKVRWYAEAIDIIIRALTLSENNTIGIGELHRLFGYSGMHDYYQIDEWAQKLHQDPGNWDTRSTYGDEIERYYVGKDGNKMQSYLGEGSRFYMNDMSQICQNLWSQGVIDLTPDRRWVLASASR